MAALDIKITDMAGVCVEHSMVISNFFIQLVFESVAPMPIRSGHIQNVELLKNSPVRGQNVTYYLNCYDLVLP